MNDLIITIEFPSLKDHYTYNNKIKKDYTLLAIEKANIKTNFV